MGHDYKCGEWRLFIDASQVSLKGVLLRIGNEFPSSRFSCDSDESCENTKLLLSCIQYNTHCWNTCRDSKVTALLVLQSAADFYVRGGGVSVEQ